MTQSASSPYPIRPIADDELDSFLRVDEHAFYGSPPSESDRPILLDRFEFDRTLAAFDGTTPAGVTMCYSFQLSVPGLQVLPAAGVTFVAVLPTHRRRGILSSMMRRQLADVRDRGEPLAVLWASESVIYSRYGYGRASWYLGYTLRRGEGTLSRTALAALEASGDGLRLRLTGPRGRAARAGQGLRRGAADPAGVLRAQRRVVAVRDPRPGGAPARRQPAALPAGRGRSGPRGYALYSGVDAWTDFLPENVLKVRELMAAIRRPAPGSGPTCSAGT